METVEPIKADGVFFVEHPELLQKLKAAHGEAAIASVEDADAALGNIIASAVLLAAEPHERAEVAMARETYIITMRMWEVIQEG